MTRPDLARCLVCSRATLASTAESRGWQRGACRCGSCPTGAVWLCPKHRTEGAP